jgi:hypothetical protein
LAVLEASSLHRRSKSRRDQFVRLIQFRTLLPASASAQAAPKPHAEIIAGRFGFVAASAGGRRIRRE